MPFSSCPAAPDGASKAYVHVALPARIAVIRLEAAEGAGGFFLQSLARHAARPELFGQRTLLERPWIYEFS